MNPICHAILSLGVCARPPIGCGDDPLCIWPGHPRGGGFDLGR